MTEINDIVKKCEVLLMQPRIFVLNLVQTSIKVIETIKTCKSNLQLFMKVKFVNHFYLPYT